MKLWSKEALVMGGLYGVLDTISSFLGMYEVTDLLFLMFIALIFAQCFGKTQKFWSEFIHKYPRMSYYLISIGWIPYFIMLVVAIIFGWFLLSGVNLLHEPGSGVIGLSVLGLALGLALLSLIVAFIKSKHHGNK